MKTIQFAISLIGVGLIIGFSLIVYAHANFATKGMVENLKETRLENSKIIREDIREIKGDIKKLLAK